jgi:hypothetical protein
MGRERIYLGGWIRLGCISKRYWMVGREKQHPACYLLYKNDEYLWVAIRLDETIEYGITNNWMAAKGAATQFLRDSPPNK